jgi:virulence-associated protein VapD
MYAIAFDFDTTALAANYPGPSWTNAYKVVNQTLTARGFVWQQGSLYHVNTDDMGVLFLAIQDLLQITWFPPSVRDIQAYRIEQWSNFTPIVQGTHVAGGGGLPGRTGSGGGSSLP